MDRIQARLPVEIRLDRVKPAYIAADRVADELHRVVEMAGKQSRGMAAVNWNGCRCRPARRLPRSPRLLPRSRQPATFDYGRLDRLVGHVLGSDLDDLMARYQEAAGKRTGPSGSGIWSGCAKTVTESKKGGRVDLVSLVRQLNDMVHLTLEDLEALLSQAVGHEYDKWAQRQLSESEAIAARTPLADHHVGGHRRAPVGDPLYSEAGVRP